MNKVIIMGRLTHDVELKQTQNGTSTCSFTVAVDRYSADSEDNADFIRCVAWKRQAEAISQYLGKGRRILLEGNIKTGKYTNSEGKTVYTTDVWVDRFYFCDSKNDAQTVAVPVTDSIPASTLPPQNRNAAQLFAEKAKAAKIPVEVSNTGLSDFEEVISDSPLPWE